MQTETKTPAKATRTLADYTSSALIVPQLHSRATTAVMQELNDVMHRAEAIVPDHLLSSSAALNRELLTSMVLDFGAALPQVHVPSLQRPRFALGRAVEPLPWRASFYPPIELVFLIVEPSKATPEFKALRATLHRLARDRLRLDDLRHARTAEEMLAVLAQLPIVTASEPTLPPGDNRCATPMPAAGTIHSSCAPLQLSLRRVARLQPRA